MICTSGAFRSILIPPIGVAVAQFPARSHTVRESVAAFAVSIPGATWVVRLNDASPGLANPAPWSTALQASATLSALQPAGAAAQVMVGATASSGIPTAYGESDATVAHSVLAAALRVVGSGCHAPSTPCRITALVNAAPSSAAPFRHTVIPETPAVVWIS